MISRHPHFELLQPARNAGSRVRLPAVVCYLDPLAHLERGRADVRARRWWLWALSAAPPLRGTRNAEHVGAPLPPSLGALDACGGAARARSCGGGSGGARLVKSLLEHLAKLDRHVLHLLLLLRDLGVLAGQLLRAPERATH